MKRLPVQAETLRVVRLGHGANCSSVGSVLDLLFATAAVGSAVFVAAAAAIAKSAPRNDEDDDDDDDDATRDETGDEPP